MQIQQHCHACHRANHLCSNPDRGGGLAVPTDGGVEKHRCKYAPSIEQGQIGHTHAEL